MRLAITIAAALLVWAALAVPASAQEPGVHVDPDSPTGQEYDIPLERARRKSSPSEDESSQGSRTPADTLFGAGIEPSDDDGGGGGTGGSSGGGSVAGSGPDGGKTNASTTLRRPSAKRPATVEAAISNPGAPDGGAGGTLLLGGIAVALLGAGLAGGLLLRRRA
jgi:hypothetical protein